ncbi:hypothetical protein W02_39750 [Nitrospira sp. KM1]|uniref:lasso peptide biosynthesis B2 protein n=1 Tax=Nitrospira sp. KM1 TaxID=1936990 RepID=UPI0013A736A7|nr:lasso peptide biosynthesis B2 protein [Nitrospira sp. KM1]BCA56835.1 hypothetical protein W02_39750 [Nitrospira sp. KM1]
MSGLVSKYVTIAQAGATILRVRWLSRRRKLPQVLAILSRAATVTVGSRTRIDDAVYYTDRWLELFPFQARGNCFPRTLALYSIARRAGYPVQFHCGVRRRGSGLDGHAWLTLNGSAFYEMNEDWKSFTVTFSYTV